MIRAMIPHSVERYLFLAVVLLNALPVLLFKYFPTMDGPAHLYNSRLIHELLFGETSNVGLFYSFTAIPVPNWLGHFILAAAHIILPAFLAEKILLVLYVVGLPYAFRQLIRTISPQNIEYSYFILPFCFSYLFTLGFYNFSLALILMFITMATWIRTHALPRTVRMLFGLLVLLTLLYFAHIFVFGLTLFMLGLHIVITSIPTGRPGRSWINTFFRSILPGLGRLMIASAVPLILALWYWWRIPAATHYTFIEKYELLEWVYTVRPIISYNTELESVYTRRIFHALAVLFVMSVFVFPAIGRGWHNGHAPVNRAFFNWRFALFWKILCLFFLLLYLFMPDQNGSAGYMSLRLGLLLLMFFIAALSLYGTFKWFTWAVIIFILYCNYNLGKYYVSVIEYQNKFVMNCERAGSHIPPGSIVYPVDRSMNWLAGNYSNYLGIDKPMVILDNYEAVVDYFPLHWDQARIPNLLIGRLRVADLMEEAWVQNEGRPDRYVDHVFVLGDHQDFENDTGNDLVKEVLAYYELIYWNEDCALYRFTGPPRLEPPGPGPSTSLR
jgi:hypothetical protein